jgi:Family of unknown function (DUF6055)
MAFLRRSLVLCVVLAGAAVLAGPTLAAAGPRGADLICPSYPNQLGSPHFLVHYMSDNTPLSCDVKKAITETQAGDILGYAEDAYAAEIGTYGFPAPPSDGVLGGDSRIDIYVTDEDSSATGTLGVTWPDSGPPSTTASINIDAPAGISPAVVAHELFHVIQLGIWLPANPAEYWLLEETAEWMSAKVNQYPDSFVADLGPTDMALDCKDAIGTNKCDLKDGYANGGYSRWPFWQSVTQLYGHGFVKEVFLHGAANPGETGVAALQGALAAHGATLADTFINWTIQQMAGTYGLTVLDQVKPKIWGAAIKTGTTSATLPAIQVPVNHLATRLVEFDRGDGSGASACFAATLSLTVTMPAGIASRPYFYWNGLNSTPVALAVNGTTATATVPWDTCTWSGNRAYLNLPNPSTDPTANGAVFTVVAKLTVDPNSPGQSAAPPKPATVIGPVIPVADDGVPTVYVFGPELLRLQAGAPIVRLVLLSTGEGKVRATLGSTVLGTTSIRPGGNDIRFALPKSLLEGLRRSSSAASNVLTLTPLSSTGAAAGTPVTRRVAIAPVKKPATKRAR